MSDAAPPAMLEATDLAKTFYIGFFRKRVDAVRGVSFRVERGETFGLLGPNGAGKTTTIKMALRLIFPTTGTIRILGAPAGDRATMKRLGYLPESPYVYQYLKPLEFLDLCGRLVGHGRARSARSDRVRCSSGSGSAARPIGRSGSSRRG